MELHGRQGRVQDRGKRRRRDRLVGGAHLDLALWQGGNGRGECGMHRKPQI